MKRLTALTCLEQATPASPGSGLLKLYPNTTDIFETVNAAGIVRNLLQSQFVLKSTDETVNNSLTLQDDDELLLPNLEINSTYLVRSMLIYTSVTATPDLKLAFTIPTSSTWKWTPRCLQVGATTANDNINFGLLTGTANTGSNPAGTIVTANGTTVAFPIGILRTAGTAGTLRLQWAQNTQTAENTTVKADSWIMAEKVA